MSAKKTEQELLALSKSAFSSYLIEITQTDICKDSKYCDLVMKIWASK